MVIYADLVFLLNFGLDAATLAATARTRRLRVNWWRIAVSAGIGASYVMFLLIPSLSEAVRSLLFTAATKTMISLIMVWISFGFGGWRSYLQNVASFYLVNFAAAGAVYGSYFLLQPYQELMRELLEAGVMRGGWPIGLGFVIVSASGGIWLYRRAVRQAKQRAELAAQLLEVSVAIAGTEVVCTGLVDTGNRLYDPLTRTPVMVLQADRLGDLLPRGWLERLSSDDADKLVASLPDSSPEAAFLQDRLRLVPYRGINRSTRFMLALKPDSVKLTRSDGAVHPVSRALVGLDGGKLSPDGSYHAILHPGMLEQSGWTDPPSAPASAAAKARAGDQSDCTVHLS
ncbi:sigma-E processing peptidase SpoIIGA [Paenibacillus thermoaerophilus]|uniref:Sigma-E processing peptidase SpoIIGA n=1 Tax=Paenibacillus thermoaerophilus TaxID=1215385 RepID=A0ABW2UXQ5_9BACL|nr:sigma-E processing peptidase SpoIIGA [Paenibacillus thermoaerophilus]